MDFFARQERARAQTRQLIALFVLAVIVVDLAVTVVLMGVFAFGSRRAVAAAGLGEWLVANLPAVAVCALGVLAIILVGAGFKTMQLQGGGSVVARLMGADLVDGNTADPAKKRLLNVVEEMAIASGVPVPSVYVMEGERGINAFAAGHSAANSAITVTRGALDRFDRAELQGVIGHEFSHILNGDMRLNMRLLGMVAGLFAIAAVGRLLLRGSSGRSKSSGGLVIAGLAMFVLGYIGLLLGRMIQAAISRQREFLADASAVQFTRDPSGLRDALVKVGATEGGSIIHAHDTQDVAHMLFASGLTEIFATHPPLVERIRALDPSFQPEDLERAVIEALPKEDAPAAAPVRPRPTLVPGLPGLAGVPGAVVASAVATAAVAADPARIAASVGRARPPHVRYAERLREALPDALAAEASDPSAARVLLATLLWCNAGADAAQGAGSITDAFGSVIAEAAAARRVAIDALPESQRLPLLLQLVPALGRLPLDERQGLVEAVNRMVRADGTITLSEYALARLARVHLGSQISPTAGGSGATLLQLEQELQVVFSTLAHFGHANETDAKNAYERGFTRVLPGRQTTYAPVADWVPAMDAALDRLDTLKPEGKQRLVDALATIVASDGTLELAEAELLRAICGSVHCPLPPLLDETQAA